MKEVRASQNSRKETKVFVDGNQVIPDSRFSKENWGRSFAPKEPIYGEENYAPMADRERELVSFVNKNGIPDMKYGSIKAQGRQATENLDDTADQRAAQAEGELKDSRMRIPSIGGRR